MSANKSGALSFAYLHNIVGSFGLTVSCPGFHELTALLQRVAPSVGLFGLIATPDGRYDGAWLTGIGGW
jgi:hypothetical protein